MGKAKALYGDLEVEVFKDNSIGRRFYAKYVLELLQEKFHEPTGQKLLRLKHTANNFTK
jgi:putative acetyltransferase